MSAPADLAEFRLLRALRAGQPGAFPTLWNAQAGAVWSVIRALANTDAEALGWATSFRVDLAERVVDFGTGDPVAAQVGGALYAHLHEGFAVGPAGGGVGAPLPPGPLPPTEEGARRIPPAARLLYLVDLFFDVPIGAVEPLAGREARHTLDAVRRLIEPGDDTDARLYVHTALMRPAPADALILPPGAEPPPPKPRWWLWALGGAGALLLLSAPWIEGWIGRPDLKQLAALHAEALEDAPLREGDPAQLGILLSRRGVPALLTDVPDLSAAGFTLLGARIEPGAEPTIVLIYQLRGTIWTLQHLGVAPDVSGPVLALRTGKGPAPDAPGWTLEARQAPGAVVVVWDEASTSWALAADAPPEDVLAAAARIRENRALSSVPFLGTAPALPPGGASE
jgi:hypothetical protein